MTSTKLPPEIAEIEAEFQRFYCGLSGCGPTDKIAHRYFWGGEPVSNSLPMTFGQINSVFQFIHEKLPKLTAQGRTAGTREICIQCGAIYGIDPVHGQPRACAYGHGSSECPIRVASQSEGA